jgi:dihydroflavonol-4-reductase
MLTKKVSFPCLIEFDDTQQKPNSSLFRDLVVAPAIKGTKNIFNQAKKTPSVKRIVMTSTMWACMSDAQDVVDSEEAILDETMWNSTASLHYQPYAYGKTEAEKDAWIKLEKQDHWDVVTILPGLILGPGTKCHRDNYAFQLMTNFGNGTYKGGVPAISTAVVDVRDVSRAHIEAAFRPRADGRYLCVRHQTDHFEMTQILRNQYPKYEFPKSATSKQYLAMFGSLFSRDMNRKFITRNVGMRFQLDSSRSEEELGIVYRSLHQTLIDMMEQIIEEGLLDKEKMAEEARLKKEEEDRIKQEKKEAKEKRKEERLVREREERDKKKAERAAEKERKRAERQGQRQGGSGAAQPEASVV